MTETFFVDSNVLVYRRDSSERSKQPRAAEWIEALWRTGRGRLSVQVLEEFYQVTTRRLRPGLPKQEARSEVRDFVAWSPVALTPAVLDQAWDVEERYKLSFWDSVIVAAAQGAGCRYLLSEDLQAGQDLDGVLVVDPFVEGPADFEFPKS